MDLYITHISFTNGNVFVYPDYIFVVLMSIKKIYQVLQMQMGFVRLI